MAETDHVAIKLDPLRLAPGKFYVDKAGMVWCCFRLDESRSAHNQADCVRVLGQRLEYFYADGRYDADGAREHTLVREASDEERDRGKEEW